MGEGDEIAMQYGAVTSREKKWSGVGKYLRCDKSSNGQRLFQLGFGDDGIPSLGWSCGSIFNDCEIKGGPSTRRNGAK